MFSSVLPACLSQGLCPAARRRLHRPRVPTPRPAPPRPLRAQPQRSPVAALYQDGTYSADGSYVSPNGTETVGVELTLAAGTVTAVNVTQHPSNPNTRKFQGEFAGGIAAQVVGKSIDKLNVSKVAGSSLTSGGFNQALDKIKAEAQ